MKGWIFLILLAYLAALGALFWLSSQADRPARDDGRPHPHAERYLRE